MAKETIVRLTDDIEGAEAVETMRFALRGVEYEIDLSEKNVGALERIFERYTKAASASCTTGQLEARGRGATSATRGDS
jgi:Lsr2